MDIFSDPTSPNALKETTQKTEVQTSSFRSISFGISRHICKTNQSRAFRRARPSVGGSSMPSTKLRERTGRIPKAPLARKQSMRCLDFV